VALSQAQAPNTYTIVTRDGRRTVPSRTSGNVDFLPLDQLAPIFGLTINEDRAAGGLTITTKGQRITVSLGQPLASINGRMVSLSGPVTRQGAGWSVPADFLSKAVGPAIGQRIEVRKGARMILVDLRMPQVAARIDREGTGARLVIEFQPATSHQVTRDGSRLTVHFDADQLDATPLVGALPDFVAGAKVDGASLIFDLGRLATNVRTTDESDRVIIDLQSGPATGSDRPAPSQEAAPADLSPATGIKIIMIDPGHGGDDAGVHGASGTLEKDVTMQAARRLKTALEKGGFRVLLTRDGDDTVPLDRRTAAANNNKADLFISLHANGAFKPDVRGAQVLSLDLDEYKHHGQSAGGGQRVPTVGGGSRLIDTVQWELAQIPYAPRSAVFAAVAARHLADQGAAMFERPTDVAPLAVLAGANMPAVLIELGFLTNGDDERVLGGDALGAMLDAIAAAVGDVRGGIPEPEARPIR